MTSPESPSSLLERAADLIENLACGAPDGPWHLCPDGDFLDFKRERVVVYSEYGDVPVRYAAHADTWIETMNPSVATPLVAWLRAEANTASAWADTAVRWPGVPDSYRDAPPSEALKFARLILKES